MLGHDIIVVGTSAGGVETLSKLVADLPADLPAAIFVVIHIPAYSKSNLPSILNRKGTLRATHAEDGEAIAAGRIYIAPPDYHLLIKSGYIRLVKGPKENSCRPAVDPLFRTAARAYGQRVVGVILSGMLDDGTAGLIDVKRYGGVAVVQDPKDALYNSMPSSAIENITADYILPLSSIAPVLIRLAHTPALQEGAKTMPSESEMEPDVVELDGVAMRERGKPGPASHFTCPDCGGTLFQLQERELLQFRCRTGHAFSVGTLMALQSEVQEEALWAAIRSLEERGDLLNQMAIRARNNQRLVSAKRFSTLVLEAQQRADLIRQALFQGQLLTTVLERTDEEGSVQQNSPIKVVVLAASSGGLNALSQLLPSLPSDFPAIVIVVQHLDSHSDPRTMMDVINHPTIPLKLAQAGEPLRLGIAYVVPPQAHLLVNPNGTFSLTSAVFVDFSRPSIDLLLESVAASFQERAIAVILSGTGSDGALGVQAIHKMGGKVIAQDESTAEFSEMPNAAIQTGTVNTVLPINAIASALVDLVMTSPN